MKNGASTLRLISFGAWLCVGLLLVIEFLVWGLAPSSGSSPTPGHPIAMALKQPLTVLEYPSSSVNPAAIILFASGDGGWNDFEQDISHTLQDRGYTVVGIDSASYAVTDYDLPTLQADFTKIAQTEEARYGPHPPPLIVGGYSMGAAQAIAVAGGPHPPPKFEGAFAGRPVQPGPLRLADLRPDECPPHRGRHLQHGRIFPDDGRHPGGAMAR